MLMSITVFAMTAFFGPVATYYEGCISERCFTISGSNETKNFNDARKWCFDRNSNLAVVPDNNTQEAITEFLNSAQLNEQPKSSMFIDLTLQKQNTKTWYLVNGTPYLGGLAEQNEGGYRNYGYIKINSNTGLFGQIQSYVYGSIPNSLRNFICEFEISKCSINSTNYYLYKGRCFIKYENESLSWFYARERCKNNDGDLATFNYDSGTTGFPPGVPFSTSWLNPTLSYWVGIRWNDWQWKSYGGYYEIVFTWWLSTKPNNINFDCVCMDPNGDPAWGWTDCSCTEPKQFVCIKVVPTTIATTTGSSSSVTTSSTVSFPFPDVTNSPCTSSVNNGLIVGLVLGILVILPLLIINVILVIIIIRQRRSRERTQNNENVGSVSQTKQTEEGRSATQLQAPVAEVNYQHLKRETMFGPGSAMPLYDQLNQPENGDYELTQ